jgi:DNA-binding phage protein
MTDDHKAKLAEGRTQGRAIRNYLDAVAATKPKRGRKRTPDSIKKRIDVIEKELETADALKALNLRQERRDLLGELGAMNETVNLDDVEKDFVAAAKGYSERRGISYEVWREAGVPAEVLKKAGISRSS